MLLCKLHVFIFEGDDISFKSFSYPFVVFLNLRNQLIFRLYISLQLFIRSQYFCVRKLQILKMLLNTVFTFILCLNKLSLTFQLQLKLLNLTSKCHRLSMRLNVSLLLLFISTDPNFPRVFLGGYLLILLVNLIHHLFTLDFCLFLKSLFLDFNSIYVSFWFSKFFRFIFVFHFEIVHQSISFLVSTLKDCIVFLELS